MSNMVVSTNIMALNSHRSLKGVGNMQSKASQRLSSGYRINSAADDAAGLAISEKMRAQIRGLDMASKNAQDAISLIQTAEGGMQEIDNMLQRIRELTVQVSSDTNEHNELGTGDRQKIQDEINQLTAEIDSMAERVEFNKKKVINGSFANTKDQLAVSAKDYAAAQLNKINADAAVTALNAIKDGAATVNGSTAKLDAKQALLDAGEAVYKTAVETFKTAEVTFNGLVSEYGNAKTALLKAMADSDVANVGALDKLMFDPADTTGVYLGAEKAVALAAAVSRYSEAAVALGVDDLDLQSIGTPLTQADLAKSFAAAVAPPTASTANKTANDTTTGLVAGKGEKVWDTAKATFATAKAAYEALVLARDIAQDQLNDVNARLDSALTDQNRADTMNIASTSKFDAATNADKAGSGTELYFQVGANAAQGLIMSINSVKTDVLGIGDGKGKPSIDVLKMTGADITATLDVLDSALSYVTTERSKLGAAQNRLEYTIKSLDISSENLSASESRIRDTDMAKEMMNFTKANVLQQAATSMLAQANQAPQMILKLLG